MSIVRVAVDVPLDDHYDFLAGEGPLPPEGALVVVPFGRTKKVGVVVGLANESEVPRAKLKPIEGVVPDVPPISAESLEILRFCASYYQRPLGEVIAASLPPRLRQVSRRPLPPPGETTP